MRTITVATDKDDPSAHFEATPKRLLEVLTNVATDHPMELQDGDRTMVIRGTDDGGLSLEYRDVTRHVTADERADLLKKVIDKRRNGMRMVPVDTHTDTSTNLKEFIAMLEEQLAGIPEEYQDYADVHLITDEAEDDQAMLEITYLRDPTPAEEAEEERAHHVSKIQTEKYEREQLAKLLAKYPDITTNS